MIEIRSYRRVFDLERRIYSVDRFRLNPGGIPVRGVVYFLVAVAAALALGAMPLLGAPVQLLPWYFRDLLAPGAVATLLSLIRLDGRTFHLAASGLLGMLAGPRRISGLARASAIGARWIPPELILLPDGSDGRLRRFRYRGPGAALVRLEHRRSERLERRPLWLAAPRVTVCVTGLSGARPATRAQVIVLERGASLSVDPGAETAER